MKMYYETPKMELNKFDMENVITTSAVETGIKEDMENNGYTVTSVSLNDVNIVF